MNDAHQFQINESPDLQKHRILVVDDDREILGLVSQILSSSGYSLSLGSDGEEGLHEFRSTPPDLVLTDLEMPGMNGIDLACHVKALSPHTPVVLMTGCGKEEVTEKTSGNHIDHILFKPFRPTDMEEIIRTLLPG